MYFRKENCFPHENKCLVSSNMLLQRGLKYSTYFDDYFVFDMELQM